MKIVFGIIITLALSCCFYNCTSNLKLEVPVTFNSEVKTSDNTANDSIGVFDVELVKKEGNGKYLLSYHITGSITSNPDAYKKLDKILIQEEVGITSGFDKIVEMTPLSIDAGKSPNGSDEYRFDFKNEYELRVPTNLEVAQVKFVCGNKAKILILPRDE